MKKIDNPIEELTKRINTHINAGGNIYQPKRQLAYYDYLQHVKEKLSKRDGVEYSSADIYKMCGIEFDPDYQTYLEIVSDLQDLSDENNYVDKTTSFKASKPETYGKLATLSTKHHSCLYDFLVVTTGYRLKEANINLDYENALVERLRMAYPSGDITGIRRDNTDLYEMLRHLKRYRYPALSMIEIIDILGFTNSRMQKQGYKQIDEAKTVAELEQLYPSKNIDSSLVNQKGLYYRLLKISILHNLSLVDYLNSLGYTYLQGNLVPRLAQMKVDEHKRFEFLTSLKAKFYSKHKAETLTDKERYYLNLELIDKVAKLDNLEEFIKTPSTTQI